MLSTTHLLLLSVLASVLPGCGDTSDEEDPSPDTPVIAGASPQASFERYQKALRDKNWGQLYSLHLPSTMREMGRVWERNRSASAESLRDMGISEEEIVVHREAVDFRDFFVRTKMLNEEDRSNSLLAEATIDRVDQGPDTAFVRVTLVEGAPKASLGFRLVRGHWYFDPNLQDKRSSSGTNKEEQGEGP